MFDIIEIKLLADLVAYELEKISETKKRNNSEAQREFDLRALLHKLSALEESKKWKNINYMMFLIAGIKKC